MAFSSLFTDLHVYRMNDAGAVVQKIAVPVAQGSKQAWVTRLAADPELNKPVSVTLPRIGLTIAGFSYDGTRKLQRTIRRGERAQDRPDVLRAAFVPAPWNINYTMSVISNHIDDANQIMEQVLPFFSPELTLTVRVVPEMDVTHDVPIVLTGTTYDDNYEAGFGDQRLVTWDLSFTMRAYLYGPVGDVGVIRKVTLDYYSDLSANAAGERATIEIDPPDALETDDYTIVTTDTELNVGP